MAIDLTIAFLSLLEHRRRNLILALAIAAVASTSLFWCAVAESAERSSHEVATTLTSGDINVGGFHRVGSEPPVLAVAGYQAIAQLVTRALPELDSVVERGRGIGRVVSDDGVAIMTVVAGLDIQREPEMRRLLALHSGSLDGLARPNGLLLFEEQAKKLGVRVGDVVTVIASTRSGAANTADCEVVAIARELGAVSRLIVYTSNPTWRQLYQLRDDVVGALHLRIKPQFAAQLTPLVERLHSVLAGAGYRVRERDMQSAYAKLEKVASEEWTGQALDLTTWEDELAFVSWTTGLLQGIGMLLVSVLASVALVGTMNTLAIAVRERTREIGTLRALGLQRSGTVRLFLLEAGMLGLASSLAGTALAALTIAVINACAPPVPLVVQAFVMQTNLQLVLDSKTAASVIALTTVATTLAALLPSLRAARLTPTDAIAHVG